MQHQLIDLHCDTLSCIWKSSLSLAENDLTISLKALKPYQKYVQFFASWCSSRRNDNEGFEDFLRMADYLDAHLTVPTIAKHIVKVRTAAELDAAIASGRHAAILAVEDGRILGGDLSRLDILAARGVRYMTLCWSGETCIGGSFDTDVGLTEFGKQAVNRCFALGIVPDLSHTCEKSAQDAIDLAAAAGKPLFASHSNAYGVYAHPRNLRDHHFEAIRDGGGLVGLNFYCEHLCNGKQEKATVSHLVRHLEHYLALDGENVVAIGGDWDGACLPEGFDTIADATKLADELARLGYTNRLIQKLFLDNAYDFIRRNFDGNNTPSGL